MDKAGLGIPRVSVRCMAVSLLAVIWLAVSLPASAADPSADANLEQWQLRRLNEPTERERAHEREGNVYIYDRLTDREVNQALNAHFDRIEYMLFVGTRKTGSTDSANSTKPIVQQNGAAQDTVQRNAETESPGCL